MPARFSQAQTMSLAGHYAQALLELTAQAGSTEQVLAELQGLAATVRETAGLEEYLDSPFIPPGRKWELVESGVKGKVSELTRNFLGVLVRNGRAGFIVAVAQRFEELNNDRLGRVSVTVQSAVELDDAMQDRLKVVLREALAVEPMLQLQVDKSMLGGLRLRLADQVIDASLDIKLQLMHAKMLRQSGIQARKAALD